MRQREESNCFDVSGGCGNSIAGSVKQCFGNEQCTGNFPNFNMPVSTVRKILRNILQCYAFKIRHVQELVPADLPKREDEAHFHLRSSVNTQNCRIWTRENPFKIQPLPLHSQKVTVWCGFTAAFIVGPFFFEEIGPLGLVSCTVNGTRYESLLRNQLIPTLQQRGYMDSTIFMQDGAPTHIATPVKQLLNLNFGNDRIISRHFPTAWPPRSPDLNPCVFWLRGYLKDVVYGVRLRT
ncbi:hypothetical protein AVEN_249684-1 [Araneus ventricosus]|uniref:Tc1-like transposase DDE domain-containing protein n=1 Tax=Araneus ventricosus TaxID=182803 RepID=A0A4Y2FA63_ARAVE|nr:hypothetical protein AVEN_249684-1 [Araneus ventricosus]